MANILKSRGRRVRLWLMGRKLPARTQQQRHRPRLEFLEDRTLPAAIGDVFAIFMENHNLTQPSGLTGSPEQLLGNTAAPYLNNLMTPGNPNALQTSYAGNYNNVPGNHPSEPNYVWREAGLAGPLNDNDPYPNNIVNAPNLTALLQAASIPWKSYQEDIDLMPSSGSVNQPGANSLTGTVAPQSEWTVPLISFSGTSSAYVNPYNGSNQYAFAPKHDGPLFFQATNGGDNFSPSNPEAPFYAPLQQLQTDLSNNTTARYNIITPDLYDDMHSPLNTNFTYNGVTYTANTDQEAVAQGDNFLSIVIPEIMASQAYKNNGAIVITFDETEGGDTSQYTLPTIVISPLAKGNAFDSTLTYTHSSYLKSMQEIFGVSAPGGGFLGGANTPGTNDLSNLFIVPTLTVTNMADTGAGSLRQAISNANANGTFFTSAISFDIGNGNQVITPASALPAFTTPITIDATPPAGFSTQTIVLDPPGHVPEPAGSDATVNGDVHAAMESINTSGSSRAGAGSHAIKGTNVAARRSIDVDSGHAVDITATVTSNAIALNFMSGYTNDHVDGMGPGSVIRSSMTGNLVDSNGVGTDVSGADVVGDTGNGILFLGSGNPMLVDLAFMNTGLGIRLFEQES